MASDHGKWIREAVIVLYVLNEARRIERLLHACNGDREAAMRVYRELQRAEAVERGYR